MTQHAEHIRWNDREWTLVAGAAAPLVKKGQSKFEAFLSAQRTVLPVPRRREKGLLQKMLSRSPHLVERYLTPALKAFDKIAAVPMPTPVPPPPPPTVTAAKPSEVRGVDPKVHAASRRAAKEQKKLIRWLPIEWAAVAVEVKRLKDEGTPGRYAQLIAQAQMAVLSPDRWRRPDAIYQGDMSDNNARQLTKGWENKGLLTPATERESVPEAVLEMVTTSPVAEARPTPVTPPPVASAAPPAPTPAPQLPRASLAFAMQAFAHTIESALSTLLTAHAEHIYSTMDARFVSAADSIAQVVAKQISDGLRRNVLDVMNEELGGTSSAPAASSPPAPSAPPSPNILPGGGTTPSTPIASPSQMKGPAAYAAERAAAVPVVYKGQPKREPQSEEYPIEDPADEGKIKVDVIGMNGHNITEVKSAFNGHTSLRFIDIDHIGAWVPRKGCSVVMATKFISHKAPLKCARYHVKPIFVNGGAASVVHAIEAIHQAEGVPV